MDADRENKMANIKDKIEQGEYRIDPHAVADAIMRRFRGLDPAVIGARDRPSITKLIDAASRPST